MRIVIIAAGLLAAVALVLPVAVAGLTPEQIYQAQIKWENVTGTWEALPDDNPLSEKDRNGSKPSNPTLITLRKDGTCRIISRDYPLGLEGLWTVGEREIVMSFKSGSKMEFYVYGVRDDFMMTTTSKDKGGDQLWSRVK